MTAALLVNMAACAVIFVWSTWCVFSRRVHDGILGKVLFAIASLAALGVLLGPQYGYDRPHTAEVTLNAAIALLGLRHLAMKYLWPRLCRAIRCATCPHSKG